jgi:acetyltransferase-like isoleucine patch superfamily enzyme
MEVAKLRRLAEPDFRRYVLRRAEEETRARMHGQRGARIARGVKLTGNGTYELGRGSRIKPDAQLFVAPGATLRLGVGSAIGIRNIVNAATAITIGDGTRFSWDCQILDTDFHEVFDEHGRSRPFTSPITIGHHVLVGTGALILKGVTIGDGAVVGAGSVVTRDVEPGTIVAGNPARPVGRTSGWAPGRV